jgi:hypothetical protein
MRTCIELAVLIALVMTAVGSAGAADGIQTIGNCRTVDKPGAYVLAKNLQATGDCLVITSSFVTLDLAGYVITGNGAGTGITGCAGGQLGPSDITIRNGNVTHFNTGISLCGRRQLVEYVRAVDNTSFGIVVIATSADLSELVTGDTTLQHNTVSGNGDTGISANSLGGGFTVAWNVANSNNGFGISVICPGVVMFNTATGNAFPAQIAATGCQALPGSNSTPLP